MTIMEQMKRIQIDHASPYDILRAVKEEMLARIPDKHPDDPTTVIITTEEKKK